MSLGSMMRRRAYRAELFGDENGEVTKRYILGEDVEFKNKKAKRRWWNWFRKLVKK